MNLKKGTSSSAFERIREHFHFTSLLKPMIYALIFSVVYNLGYLWFSSHLGGFLYNILTVLWLCLYGLSWYFVSTLIFGRRRGTLSGKNVSMVLLWFLAWNFLVVFVIVPLYNFIGRHGSNPVLMILIQLCAAFVLICMIPASILFFKALYKGMSNPAQIIHAIYRIMKRDSSAVFNSWLILFILMVVWDTLFSGPLTIYFGFNAVHLMMQLLYLGNPMGFWMLLMSAIGGGISGAYLYAVILNIMIGLIFNFLDINLIAYLGSYFED